MRTLTTLLCAVAALLLGSCKSATLNEDIPLPEHPRPDFERTAWVNLNGHWSFTFDEASAQAALTGEDLSPMDKQILVPFPWGSKLSEVEDEGDIAWYGREITIPKSWKGKRVFLVVGASDWETTAWMDGQELGTHQGGYIPFEFELEGAAPGSTHRLVLKADDTYSPSHLYGKQGYGNARGIWQTVYLEARGKNFIKTIHFTPDIDNSTVQVDVTLDSPAAEGEAFKLQFKTGGQKTFTGDIGGKDRATFIIPIKDQHLWDLDDPFLYEVKASLGKEDEVITYFGQRKIGVEKLPGTEYPYVALNGKPVYLQLCLDQSYHPEGFYTFPSDQFMKDEILLSKRLGLSGNRIHIKVEVPRKLYWADKLGLLIMADTPNFWGEPVPEAKEDWERCLRGQLERDYNHPSIFAWVNFNETWGLKTGGEYLTETQEWVRSMYKLTKSLDPSRLVEDNSPCLNDHVETDINSWHAYRRGHVWEATIKEYCDNTYPGSAFNYIGSNLQANAPMINSECGNVWGYEGSGGDCDFTWDYHIMVDAFRRNPKCAGWLYTEHHDVINEWNGYVKFDRTAKTDGLDELLPGMTVADFQSPYYISPECYLYTERSACSKDSIPFTASFMTDKDPGAMTLQTELVGWNTLGEFKELAKGEVPVAFKPYLNQNAGAIDIDVPEENGLYLLRLVLKSGSKVLHRNFTTFRVKDGKDAVPENSCTVTFPPASFTAQEWSVKHTSIYSGLKENGFGHGYFEYTVELPQDIDPEQVASAELLFEASAKELFGKDREGDDIQGDFMLGGGTFDHCKSPNSYAMTDGIFHPSKVEVSVNGIPAGGQELKDDPADHRGILSWAAQPNERHMCESGSYGELVRVSVPAEALAKGRTLVVRLSVPEDTPDGGLAIYGKDFGRYPLDPTLIIHRK